jgi:alginate O-acetyltransferase complex protein AlgI
MNFSSPTFIFFFLPIVLLVYWLMPARFRPWVLLISSILFYLWGDILYAFLIAGTLFTNYILAQRLVRVQKEGPAAKRIVVLALMLNLGVLAGVKFLVAYFPSLVSALKGSISAGFLQDLSVAAYMPLGLSFISFQALALIFDLQKGRINTTQTKVDLLNSSLYLLLFPKVTAGPITRFGELIGQIKMPQVKIEQVMEGISRFIIGLAKKTIIADQLAPVVNSIFALNAFELTTLYAWLGLIGYSLQLYFDFSGYTDMALGIGQMLGLKLPENFDYPYIATSISNFWRRWHISLSNWFRDYLFYPLERARRGKDLRWQYADIMIVFLATGLWHGVTPNFIIWGLLHGAAVAFENTPTGGRLKKSWVGFQHFYSLSIILVGWVLFRSRDLRQAFSVIRALLGFDIAVDIIPFEKLPVTGGLVWIALIAGFIFIFPTGPWLKKRLEKLETNQKLFPWIIQLGSKVALICLLIASLIIMVGSSFQAALYARF